MCGVPLPQKRIVFQSAMRDGPVFLFANVANRDALTGFLAYAESGGIPGTLRGTPGATARIAEITILADLLVAWNFAFMTWRRAAPFPARAQRQPRGMDP